MKTCPQYLAGRIAALIMLVCAFSATAQPFLQPLIEFGLAEPYGVAVDTTNNLYITDSVNSRIARYNPNTGELSNFAGLIGEPGLENGPGVFARFFNPQGIVAARGGFVVADAGNHQIRFITMNGIVSTLAGGPTPGLVDGPANEARFNGPAGLAADSAGNIFVADVVNNRVRRIDLENNVTTHATGLNRPTDLAIDPGTGRIFVTDTGTHSIRVIESDGSVSLLAGSGSAFISGSIDSLVATNARFNAPRGLLWVGGNTGLLVSDTGNRLIRRVYWNTALGIYSVARYGAFDTDALKSPVSMTIDRNGNFPLVDLGSHTVYLIQVTVPQNPVRNPVIGVVNMRENSSGDLVTVLDPVVNSTFNNDVDVAILAEDGTETFYTLDPDADFPEGPDSRSTPPRYVDGMSSWSHSLINPIQHGSNVTIRAVSVQEGRRPSAVISARFQFKVASPAINGKNMGAFTLDNATDDALMYYTTDGSTPTESSSLYVEGSKLNIVDGTRDIEFRVRAFKEGYTPSEESSRIFLFADLETSSIGVTRDFTAGIGATLIVPVEIKLASDTELRSLQFLVEVKPENGAPQISTQFRNLAITTNDFIRVALPSTNAPISTTYTDSTTTGVSISFVGNSSGLLLQGSATVALLAIPIPTSAVNGQTYTISLLQPSGTTDGLQDPVILVPFRDRTITIAGQSYVVGDSAVANWYNAGDFGNGNLNNNDVNNAFHASLGLFTPYPFSDVFDAMDVFPEDSSTSVGGDGQIRFLDWQIILQRSLRLRDDNWTRVWSAGGFRTATAATLNQAANSPAEEIVSGASQDEKAWSRHALVGAATVEQASPGQQVNVPVYVQIAPGNEISGLQFRAVVEAEEGAPGLDQAARFVANAVLPSPISLQGAQDGLPLNQAVAAWSLVQNPFPSALQSRQSLGHIRFTVPSNAQPGQRYVVRFINADGSPDLKTQYDFESLPGSVWVGTPAQRPAETISDEWKLRFFGNLHHPLAAPGADADGDGIPNSEEYAAGKNPVKLRFHDLGPDWKDTASGFKLRWFGELGQSYLIETSADLQTWTSVATGLQGKGDVQEILAGASTTTQFYRVRVE